MKVLVTGDSGFVGGNLTSHLDAMRLLGTQPFGPKRIPRMVADYDAVNVPAKVVRIVLSYTSYFDTVIRKKSQRHLCSLIRPGTISSVYAHPDPFTVV
jgi:hypothetical protein